MYGVVVIQLAKNRFRQSKTLYSVSFIIKRGAGREVAPVECVLIFPLCLNVFGIRVGQELQVGCVQDAVLVFQNKSSHFLAGLNHQMGNTSRSVDRKVWIAIEALRNVIKIVFHASQVCSNYTELWILL